MRRALRITLGLLLLPVLALGGLLAVTFGGLRAPEAAELPGGLGFLILDGYVSIGVLEAGDGKLVLVDAGNSPGGEALLAGLAAHGQAPADVIGVLLTHGHPDHIAGLAVLPGVPVYALAEESPYLSGAARWRGPLPSVLGGEDTGVRVDHPVHDGDQLTLGRLHVEALATPGHTAGSASWLVDDVLFVGDNATFNADGSLRPAPWIFSDDTAENRAALVRLAHRVADRDVRAVIASHSGPGDRDALLAYHPG